MSLEKSHQAKSHRPVTAIALAVASVLALGAGASRAALPVIPGATGYGTTTVAGRGGTVYKVTNLNASGAGSLKACASDASGPRVCVFEVSGTIHITDDMMIRWGNLTIAGQTAPSPGIMIRGGAIRIQASDVLIQHIRVRVGDDQVGPAFDNRDALKLEGQDTKWVKNVVIDHCSFSWSTDEVASIWGQHDNITFSNDIFSEGLNESFHSNDATPGSGSMAHGFGVLLGSSPSGGHVTMQGNLMAHTVERNPLTRALNLVFLNNMVYDRGTMDFDAQSENYRTTNSTVVGNVFLRGPSYSRPTKPIELRTNSVDTMYAGSRVYMSDTYAPEVGTSLSSLVWFTGGDILSGLLSTTSAPVWNSGMTVLKTTNAGVYNSILQNAGARPADRDSVDKRIVNDVKTRGGHIINCVSADGSARCSYNAGGWPYIGQHTRRLTLPSNPNGVASNGYTNLENWLHSMDLSTQGVTSSSRPASPAALSVK
jgi:pectate lyase